MKMNGMMDYWNDGFLLPTQYSTIPIIHSPKSFPESPCLD